MPGHSKSPYTQYLHKDGSQEQNFPPSEGAEGQRICALPRINGLDGRSGASPRFSPPSIEACALDRSPIFWAARMNKRRLGAWQRFEQGGYLSLSLPPPPAFPVLGRLGCFDSKETFTCLDSFSFQLLVVSGGRLAQGTQVPDKGKDRCRRNEKWNREFGYSA